jgi:hypothetical protein
MTSAPPPVPLARVVLPAEHGGWSFLAEPLALGLAAAATRASWPACVLLAVAFAAGFLARQPLKLLLGDRRRGRRYPRTALAERAFAVLAAIAAAAVAGAVALAPHPFLPALALAAPVAALALAYDLAQRGREAAAELVAPLALAAAAPAMALAAGAAPLAAATLALLLVARAVPTVLYVRARLRLERGQPAGRTLALLAQVAGIAAAAFAPLAPAVRVAAVAGTLTLGARAAWGLSPARPRLTTKQLGALEAVLGGLYALAIGLAFRFGHAAR